MNAAFLTCKACSEILKEPVLLPCSHNVCKACAIPDATGSFTCPECGAAADPSALTENSMLAMMIQQAVSSGMVTAPGAPAKEAAPAPVPVAQPAVGSGPGLCPQHNKELDIFDFDERKLICSHCALFGVQKAHNKQPVHDAMNTVFGSIEQRSVRQEAQLVALTERKKRTDTLTVDSDRSHSAVVNAVRQSFVELRQALDKREAALIEEADTKHATVRSDLVTMSEELARLIHDTECEIAHRTKELDTRDPYRVLPLISVDEILAMEVDQKLERLHPNQFARMVCVFHPLAARAISHHGSLDFADPTILFHNEASFKDLPLSAIEPLLSTLERSRVSLREMGDVLSARAGVISEQLRSINNFARARVNAKDKQRPVDETWWNIINECQSDSGRALEIVAQQIGARGLAGALSSKMQELAQEQSRSQQSIQRLQNGMAESFARAESRLTDMRGAQRRLKEAHNQLLEKGGSNKRIRKRFEECLAEYQKTRAHYCDAKRTYRTRFADYEPAVRKILNDLENLETSRLDCIKNTVSSLVERLTDAALGSEQHQATVLAKADAIEPRLGVTIIANQAKRSAATAPGRSFEIELPIFEMDPSGTGMVIQDSHDPDEGEVAPAPEEEIASPPPMMTPPAPGEHPMPAAVVETAEEEAPVVEAPVAPAPVDIPIEDGRKVYMHYDYAAEASDDLDVAFGEELTLIAYDDAWSSVRNADGVTGTIPTNRMGFEAPAPATEGAEQVIDPANAPECVAAYDFEAQSPEDLSITAGEVLKRLSGDEEGWTKVYSEERNAGGIVPTSYLE